MTRIDQVVVAIPARDEERRLPAALAAVAVAAARCGRPVTVVVAADACTDRTAAVAREHGVLVAVSDAARVGAARHAAVAVGLAGSGAPPERTWIANTDADSLVPPDWLTVHLEIAETGADLLRGSVHPDPRELAAEHLLTWFARHPQTDLHDAVHGANLGVLASAYLAAGGFSPVALHEDVELVAAVAAREGLIASTARGVVTTSSRLVGRVEGGFATYLREQVLPSARPAGA